MKNPVIKKIEQNKSSDIPISLKSLEIQTSKISFHIDYSSKHSGDISIDNFYKFFCLNDVYYEKEEYVF